MSVVKDRLDYFELQQRTVSSKSNKCLHVVLSRTIFFLINRRNKYNENDKKKPQYCRLWFATHCLKIYERQLRDAFNPITLRHLSTKQNNEQCPMKTLTVGVEVGCFQGSHEGVPPPQSLRHDLVYVLHAHHPFLQSVQRERDKDCSHWASTSYVKQFICRKHIRT